MKADQARVRDLLTQTITLMCKNGLEFSRDLRVEGLLAVTVDGKDVFVVHMDERVTDQPSYASGSRYTESSIGRQQVNSTCRTVTEADDEVPVNTINDDSYLSTSSALDDRNESGSAFHIENIQSIKVEPKVEFSDDDDDDDVILMESGVESSNNSSIPLPVVQGMGEYEDDGPGHMPLSPQSKKRRMLHTKIPASVESILDDHPSDTRLWSDRASYVRNSNGVCIPQSVQLQDDISHRTGVFDRMPQTSFVSESGPRASTVGIPLPVNTLSSQLIRDCLVQFIVNPLVVNAGRNTIAFRVTWRHNNPVDLDKAWLSIRQRRQMCDDVVRRQPNVDFFFSCISGLFNKACSRAIASAFGVFPSISYYVVGDVHDSFVNTMHRLLFDAQLKPITARQTPPAANDSIASLLFIVLKDHSSKYVKQQLIRSWQSTNNTVTDPENSVLSLPIAKLIIVNPEVTEIVSNAYEAVVRSAPSFVLQLERPSS